MKSERPAGFPADVVPVTVVVTVRSPAFLAETLQSVCAQTMRPSEILVVDDGTSLVARRVAADFGATVVPVAPGTNAWNAGIARATCPWIAFASSGDLWHALKLELTYAALKRAPGLGFAFSEYEEIDADGESLGARLREFETSESLDADTRRCDRDALLETLENEDPIPLSTVVVLRQLAREAGGFASGGRDASEYEFYLRCAHRTGCVVVQLPIVSYRKSLESDDERAARLERGAVARRVETRAPAGTPEPRPTAGSRVGVIAGSLVARALAGFDRGRKGEGSDRTRA